MEPRHDPLDERNVQAIISAFPRQHIRRQRHPQGIERPDHHFDLRPRRIIFAMPKLQQPPVDYVVIPRDRRSIAADHVLGQGMDFYAAGI